MTVLSVSDAFGLSSFFHQHKRTSTIVALEDTVIAVLERSKHDEVINSLITSRPVINVSLISHILSLPSSSRSVSHLSALLPLFHSSSWFHLLDERSQMLICTSLTLSSSFPPHTLLHPQNNSPNLYFLLSGTVSSHTSSSSSSSSHTECLHLYLPGDCVPVFQTSPSSSSSSSSFIFSTHFFYTRTPCLFAVISSSHVENILHTLSSNKVCLTSTLVKESFLYDSHRKRTIPQVNALVNLLKQLTLFQFKKQEKRINLVKLKNIYTCMYQSFFYFFFLIVFIFVPFLL